MLRVADSELGLLVAPENLQSMGVYEHHYTDNSFGQEGISAHYVVFAYEYLLQGSKPLNKDQEHSELKWWKVDDILSCPNVHENTKAYFRCLALMNK